MRRSTLMLLICCLLPVLSHASLVLDCKKYSFLKKGFQLESFNTCRQLIHQCPTAGPTYEQNCVKQVVKQNAACYQTEQLARTLQSTPDAIFVSDKNKNNFMLVDQTFFADGQHSYYFITPKNCMINTKIDPRNLSVSLKKQYKNSPFMITNWGVPQFKSNVAGKRHVISILKVTKTCLACEVIGFAKVRFDFDNDGKLYNVRLIEFSKKQ